MSIPIQTVFSASNDQIEYKFVIKEGPQRVVRWEEGKNHTINKKELLRVDAESRVREEKVTLLPAKKALRVYSVWRVW